MTLFWCAVPCDLLEIDWCFRGAYCPDGGWHVSVSEFPTAATATRVCWPAKVHQSSSATDYYYYYYYIKGREVKVLQGLWRHRVQLQVLCIKDINHEYSLYCAWYAVRTVGHSWTVMLVWCCADDGDNNHFWNISQFLSDYRVQHSRKQFSADNKKVRETLFGRMYFKIYICMCIELNLYISRRGAFRLCLKGMLVWTWCNWRSQPHSWISSHSR
jgi:hypothetical protein